MGACPKCQKKLAGLDKFRGKKVKCPACKTPFVVPAGSVKPDPAATPVMSPKVARPAPSKIRRPVGQTPAAAPKSKIIKGVAVGCLALALLGGGGLVYLIVTQGYNPVGYYNELVEVCDPVMDARDVYGDSLVEAVDVGPPAAASIRAAAQKYQSALDAALAKLKAMKVPSAKTAAALHAARVRYMEAHAANLEQSLPAALSVVEDASLDAGQRDHQLAEILKAGTARLQPAIDELTQIQDRYCSEHDMEAKK